MDSARIVETLRAKRDGATLSAEDLQSLVTHIGEGSVTDAQLGAFVMAVYLQGLSVTETAALTRAMASSGWHGEWSGHDLNGPLLDKHSTGGLGDIISFLLAPMVAACGGYVPMISGRSLAHTGGTIDKLESIPGYDAFPDPGRFQEVVATAGLAIVGQTGELVPADQRLYAVRDQTATVDSVPLITASILSKKVAEGLDGLVMDVKVGNGAFMRTEAQGRPLGEAIERVAEDCGLRCRVFFTEMDQPLANCVGDGVELREAIRYLTGERRTTRLDATAMMLSSELLRLGELADDEPEAKQALQHALDSGSAADRFQRMVSALGGPSDLLEKPEDYLAPPAVVRPVAAGRAGKVTGCNCRLLGNAVHDVARVEGRVSFDHAVGVAEIPELGEMVEPDQALAVIHARSEEQYDQLSSRVVAAIEISEA